MQGNDGTWLKKEGNSTTEFASLRAQQVVEKNQVVSVQITVLFWEIATRSSTLLLTTYKVEWNGPSNACKQDVVIERDECSNQQRGTERPVGQRPAFRTDVDINSYLLIAERILHIDLSSLMEFRIGI